MNREQYTNVQPDKCPFIQEKKGKPCRKAPWKRPDATKSEYCVRHAYKDTPDLEYAVCPYEPKNVMLKTQLEHHLTVCPKREMIRKVEEQPFFNKGINFFM